MRPIKDFRMQAIRASHAVIESQDPAPEDPTASGVSLCLATGNSPSVLKRQKWFSIGCLVGGMLGLLVGGAIAMWVQQQPKLDRNEWMIFVAVPFSIGGIILLLLPATCGGWVMRRHMGSRHEQLKADPTIAEIFYVEIEDSATYHKMKVATEDVGYLGLDPTNRRAVIEGIVCRYVVEAADLISLKQVESPGGVGTEIAYRVADEVVLRIVVTKQSVWSEVLRQTVGKSRNPVLKRLAATLSPHDENHADSRSPDH